MIRVNLVERQRHLSKRQHHSEAVYGHPIASTSSRTESDEPQVVKEIPYRVVKMDDPRLVIKKKVLLRELESRQSSQTKLTEDSLQQHDRTEKPTSQNERLQSYFKTLTRDEPPTPQPRNSGPKLSLTEGAINLLFTERDEKKTPDLIKIYPVSTTERPYYFSGIHHTFTPTNKTVMFEVDGRQFSSVEGYVKSMMALELRGDIIQVEDLIFRRYFQEKGISQRQLDTWLTDRGFLYYQKALVHRLKSNPEMLKKLVETEKKVIIYTFRLDELLGSGVEYKCIDKYWDDLSALRVCIRYPTQFPLKPEDLWIVPRLIKGYNLLGCFLMAIRQQLQIGEAIEALDFELPEYWTSYAGNIVDNRFLEEEIPTKRSRMSMRTSEYSFRTPAETAPCNEFRPQTPNTIFGELHLKSVCGSVQGSPTRSESDSVPTSMSGPCIEPTFKAPLPRFSTNSSKPTAPYNVSNNFTQYRSNHFFGSTASLSTLSSFRPFNCSAQSLREESVRNASNGGYSEAASSSGTQENEKNRDQQHAQFPEMSKVSPFDWSKICSPNMAQSRISDGTMKSFRFQPFVAKIPQKNDENRVGNEEKAMESEDTVTPLVRSENSSRNPSGDATNQQKVCGIVKKSDQNGCHGEDNQVEEGPEEGKILAHQDERGHFGTNGEVGDIRRFKNRPSGDVFKVGCGPHGEDKNGKIAQNGGLDVRNKVGQGQIRSENRIQKVGQVQATSEIPRIQNGQNGPHGEGKNKFNGHSRTSEWGNQVRDEILKRTGRLEQVGNVQVQPVDHLHQVQQGQRKVSKNGFDDGQGQTKLPENTYQGERGPLRQEIQDHRVQQSQNRKNFVEKDGNSQSQSEILVHQDARARADLQRQQTRPSGQQIQRTIHIIHDGEGSDSGDELSEALETCSNPSIEVEMDYSGQVEDRYGRRREVVSPAKSNKHFTPFKLPGQRVEMEENVVPIPSTIPTRNEGVASRNGSNPSTKSFSNQENPSKFSAEPISIHEKDLEALEIPQKSDMDIKKDSSPQEKAIRNEDWVSLYPKNLQIAPLAQSIDDSDFANAFSSTELDVASTNEVESRPGTSEEAPDVRGIGSIPSVDGIFQFVRTALQGQEFKFEVISQQRMEELEAENRERVYDDTESVMSEGTKKKNQVMEACFEDENLRVRVNEDEDALLFEGDSEGYDTMSQDEEEALFRSMEEAQNNERSSQQ